MVLQRGYKDALGRSVGTVVSGSSSKNACLEAAPVNGRLVELEKTLNNGGRNREIPQEPVRMDERD